MHDEWNGEYLEYRCREDIYLYYLASVGLKNNFEIRISSTLSLSDERDVWRVKYKGQKESISLKLKETTTNETIILEEGSNGAGGVYTLDMQDGIVVSGSYVRGDGKRFELGILPR
ncbi:MAG: hypothetical protein LBE89_06850 [Helicobacteraceae bacterium]|jgi:hypothetical protein|nr:hypothetical protein [Helicobacteraceae bacterium]